MKFGYLTSCVDLDEAHVPALRDMIDSARAVSFATFNVVCGRRALSLEIVEVLS